MSGRNPNKRKEYITFRTDEETKKALLAIAVPKKWSISLLVEDIVQQWLKENAKPEETEEA